MTPVLGVPAAVDAPFIKVKNLAAQYFVCTFQTMLNEPLIAAFWVVVGVVYFLGFLATVQTDQERRLGLARDKAREEICTFASLKAS